jgi:DNA processing protein
MIPDHAYLHALRLIPGFGSVLLRHALSRFGSHEATWHASAEELRTLPRCSDTLVTALLATRDRDDVASSWSRLNESDIQLVAEDDPDYPPLLREIPDRPIALYVRGNLAILTHPSPLAVVGSRKATGYGKRATESLTSSLGRVGFSIVSGLAFGIDASAHRAALLAHAPTVAILGSGVDDGHITPQTNLPLAQEIIGSGGTIISEFPPGREANVGTFPARNRIMAGMSLGVLVIEAAEKSGSLITARLALDYGRDVFAVPGSIFTESAAGCHRLIRDGARIVTAVDDILAEYPALIRSHQNATPTERTNQSDHSPLEMKLLRLLESETLHIDAITARCDLPGQSVLSALTVLELAGLVKNIGGMHYIKM